MTIVSDVDDAIPYVKYPIVVVVSIVYGMVIGPDDEERGEGVSEWTESNLRVVVGGGLFGSSLYTVLLLYAIHYTLHYGQQLLNDQEHQYQHTLLQPTAKNHNQPTKYRTMSPTPKDSDLINPVSVDKVNENKKELELAPPLENHTRGMSPLVLGERANR
jgi:uncharacterized membrane protein YhiD involved in acid resistance